LKRQKEASPGSPVELACLLELFKSSRLIISNH
jgi:hypothetical protein